MRHINDLPDLCFVIIFSRIPLRDLLQVDKVCPRWKVPQTAACLKRRNITIFIGNFRKADEVIDVSTIPYVVQLAGKVSTTPAVDVEFNKLHFCWLDLASCRLLVELLPNITSVCIVLENVVPSMTVGEISWGQKSILMDQIILLLKKWSPKLETLKLFIGYEVDLDVKKEAQNDVQRLIHSINSCKFLKHLTFKLDDNLYRVNNCHYEVILTNVEFSIFSRLHEICIGFSTQQNIDIFTNSLVKYGAPNQNLVAITLGKLNRFFQEYELNDKLFDDNLVSKFIHFPGRPLYNEWPPSKITTFCTRFQGLQKLSLEINITTLYEKVKAISVLKQLIFLDIEISLCEYGEEEDQHNLNEIEPIPQIGSVKVLDLLLYDDDPRFCVTPVKWDKMFPNLQILKYEYSSRRKCGICGTGEEVCGKRILQPFKKCQHLHSIYSMNCVKKTIRNLTLDDL